MKYYVKKPVVVPAIQWDGENLADVEAFCDEFHHHPHDSCYESFRLGGICVWVEQTKSYAEIKPGHWIVSTSDGNGVKIHDSTFLNRYNEVAYEVPQYTE